MLHRIVIESGELLAKQSLCETNLSLARVFCCVAIGLEWRHSQFVMADEKRKIRGLLEGQRMARVFIR